MQQTWQKRPMYWVGVTITYIVVYCWSTANRGGEFFYNYVSSIKERGIYILETMTTGKLANENIGEFFFLGGQLRLLGVVRMIIYPVAIWYRDLKGSISDV